MPTVSIKKCKTYDKKKVKKLILDSLKEIGFNLNKWKNKRILLKPNLLGPYPPKDCITTHPIVIEAVAEIFKKVTKKITIADSSDISFERDTKALEVTGMKKVAKKLKINTFIFKAEDMMHEKTHGKVLKEICLAKSLKDFDLIVNIPKLKTHMLTEMTAAVKNLFGLVPSFYKRKYHILGKNHTKFANLIVDIFKHIKPELSILDAIEGLEGDGPGKTGIPKKTGLILTSDNALALDLVVADITGFENLLTNKYGLERGLIKKNFKVIGEKPKIPYKKPSGIKLTLAPIVINLFHDFVVKKPYINEKCQKCMKCVGACPAEAMKLKNGKIVIDRSKCIYCYCCSEFCPYKAIDHKRSFIGNYLERLHNKLMKRPTKKCS
ncbi:MAG: DUF362 domain-containing protein [archaeon]|nr:MAG: DUF362 domain-containing protein [archaeon]